MSDTTTPSLRIQSKLKDTDVGEMVWGGPAFGTIGLGGPGSGSPSETGLLQKNGKRPGCGSNFRLYRLDLLNTLYSR